MMAANKEVRSTRKEGKMTPKIGELQKVKSKYPQKFIPHKLQISVIFCDPQNFSHLKILCLMVHMSYEDNILLFLFFIKLLKILMAVLLPWVE